MQCAVEYSEDNKLLESEEPSSKRIKSINSKQFLVKTSSQSAMTSVDVEMKDSHDKIVILDAGAQYGKVIDRRVRECRVDTEILPLDTPAKVIKDKGFKAIIVSGGPGSVYAENAPKWDPEILNLGIPLLGICYGMQLLNMHYGGKVKQSDAREDGQFTISVSNSSKLFKDLNSEQKVLLTHRDSVSEVGSGLSVIGKSGNVIAGLENPSKNHFGVQFHPEVDLTVNGLKMFQTFLYEISDCSGNFTIKNREATCIEEIKGLLGAGSKVLALLSGGVDSTVCAALLHKAIGAERIVAIHIDNGFLRKGESEQVISSLESLGMKVKVVRAAHTFYNGTTQVTVKRADRQIKQTIGPLHSVTNPEEKRKIIGDTFMKVSNAVMEELKLDPLTTFLVQGTLRPDLIESASKIASSNAEAIKTHHNDTELVRELRKLGRVIEPLKDFHKDEVRQLGRDLGLPSSIVERHPFPGPGLAIRVLCGDEPYVEDDFADTNSLLGLIITYAETLKKPHPLLKTIQAGLSEPELKILKDISTKFLGSINLLPVRSVGVQGDCRTYSYVAALSCDDPPCWESLMHFAKFIPKLCRNVNRVVYVFGSKLSEHVTDITPTYLTENVLSTLRQLDFEANATLETFGMKSKVSQMPIVLVPIHFDRDSLMRYPSCQRSAVIRTFITNDFMTGVPACPGVDFPEKLVFSMVEAMKKVPGISRIMYDMTAKPPGTTEWE